MDFNTAVSFVLDKEGGYVNDPTDRGGETNFGISKRANPEVDVAKLTRDGAAAIYKQKYWDAIDADNLPEGLRLAAFDAAVQHGVGTAKKMVANAGGSADSLIAQRRELYKGIVANDPSQGKFSKGWAARLGSLETALSTVAEAEVVTDRSAPPPKAQSVSVIEDVGRKPAATKETLDSGMTMAEFNQTLKNRTATVGTLMLRGSDANSAPVPLDAQIAHHEQAVVSPREKEQAVGFGDVFSEAQLDPEIIPWRLIDQLGRIGEVDKWGPEDNYLLHAAEWEKDMTTNEVEQMRERAIHGPMAAQRTRAEILLQRDRNKVYGAAGELTTLAATLTAGAITDPVSLVAGMGIGTAARLAKVGSGAYVAAGRPGMAVGAMVGEQIASELAVTAAADVTGTVTSMSDYMLAPAGAVVLSAAGARGTYRAAVEKAVQDAAHDMANRSVLDSMNDGNPDSTKRKVAEQIAEVESIVTDNGGFKNKVMSEEDIQSVRDEVEGKVVEEDSTVPPPADKVDDTPPITNEDAPLPVIDKLDPVLKTPDVPELPEIDEPDVPEHAFLDDVSDMPDADEADVSMDDLPELPEIEVQTEVQALRDIAEEFKKNDQFADEARVLEEAIRVSQDDAEVKALTDMWVDALEREKVRQETVATSLLDSGGDKVEMAAGVGKSIDEFVAGLKLKNFTTTVGEMLNSILSSKNQAFVRHKKLVKAILDAAPNVHGVKVVVGGGATRGHAHPAGFISLPAAMPRQSKVTKVGQTPKRLPGLVKAGDTIDTVNARSDQWMADTAVHEVVHALTQHILYLWERQSTRNLLSPSVRNAIEKLDAVHKKLSAAITPEMRALQGNTGQTYAATDMHELLAMALTDRRTQEFLSGIPATSVTGGGRFSNALQEVLGYVKQMLGLDSRSALDEVHEVFDTLMSVHGTVHMTDALGNPVAGWPGAMSHPGVQAPGVQQYQWHDRAHVQNLNKNAGSSKEWKALAMKLTGGVLKSWDKFTDLPQGTITAIPSVMSNPKYTLAMQAIRELGAAFLGPRARVIVGDTSTGTSNGACLTAGANHVIGLAKHQTPERIMRTAVHEMGHAVYHQWASKVSPALLDAMRVSYEGFLNSVANGHPDQVARRYSVSSVSAVKERVGATEYAVSFDEFTAEQFVKYVERDLAKGGRTLGAQTSAALRKIVQQVMDYFTGAKARGFIEPEASFTAFFDDIVNRRGVPDVMEAKAAPVNPVTLPAARQAFALRMFQRAEQFLQSNPIDRNKLRVITAKIGGLSDGLRLAASGNPILNMIAALVTETTTGAAGRLTNVAIRKELLGRQLMGNAVIDYGFAYDAWKSRTGVGVFNDMVTGDARRHFDTEVYKEILSRRSRTMSVADPEVVAAADAMEAMFERARKAQVDSQTLGSGNLPLTAEGYIPQALNGQKLADADPALVAELTSHLATQFENTYAWTPQFSKDFANFYVQRSRARAMGAKGQDIMAQSVDDTDLIRQTLEDMTSQVNNPALKQQATVSLRGLGQTKTRLDVGLLARLPSGATVMDFYNTDTLNLARRYVNRTSGSVALMEFGIAGDVGIRQLREAATNFAVTQKQIPTRDELDAYDRVMAEISGLPIPGSVISTWAGNLRLFTGIQRLGSMAVAQFAETSNMIHHLGLGSLLSGLGQLPKMMGEVGRLKRGQASQNHVLRSIDFMGGDVGMETYKMTMPLDAPDGQVGTYVKQMGLGSKLLAAGSHVHAKVSLFRGLLAAQHRMVAEQITMKALRYARDAQFTPGGAVINGPSKALIDMGFSVELIAHLQQNLGRIARYDAGGNLIDLDITQLPHPDAAQAFVQAVHRGTSQIIQGTFVGEKGAWLHNDYAKLMLQFRTFGLTAVEKQWGRQRLNNGYTYAAGVLLGQMAFALPVHLARVQFNSMGREDSKEYVKNNLHPLVVTKALMNYGSMSGLAGDTFDILSGIAGGWGGTEAKELLGANRNQSLTVGSVVPALGSLDAAARVLSGNASAYTAFKQLPGSNLPFLIPIINLTK